ncbi:hypothetical protein F0562_012442 [Nyssa sinensis]|uniref:Uncharacterized protein n=1 Tax=Nyssa sinensis TaxID=561372 RepID=A0A5J4ZUR1_9ASTE|nr:hypothetical protein F0562_012442 [Nyssa sinensis]
MVMPHLGGMMIPDEKAACFVPVVYSDHSKKEGKKKTELLSTLQLKTGLRKGEETYLATLVEIKPDTTVEVPDEPTQAGHSAGDQCRKEEFSIHKQPFEQEGPWGSDPPAFQPPKEARFCNSSPSFCHGNPSQWHQAPAASLSVLYNYPNQGMYEGPGKASYEPRNACRQGLSSFNLNIGDPCFIGSEPITRHMFANKACDVAKGSGGLELEWWVGESDQ